MRVFVLRVGGFLSFVVFFVFFFWVEFSGGWFYEKKKSLKRSGNTFFWWANTRTGVQIIHRFAMRVYIKLSNRCLTTFV